MLTLVHALSALFLLCAAPIVLAQEGKPQAGRALAEANCASCHAIGARGSSPLPLAPAFRDLHLRYPVDHLGEALAEGIGTSHAKMPEFQLSRTQVADFLAYLKTLQP